MTRLKKEYDNLPPDTPEIERLSEALERVLRDERRKIREERRIAMMQGPPTVGGRDSFSPEELGVHSNPDDWIGDAIEKARQEHAEKAADKQGPNIRGPVEDSNIGVDLGEPGGDHTAILPAVSFGFGLSETDRERKRLQGENEKMARTLSKFRAALVQILGWRELRSSLNEFPVHRIEDIAREALESEGEVQANENLMEPPNLHLLALERTDWRRHIFGRWVYSSEPFRRDIQRRLAKSEWDLGPGEGQQYFPPSDKREGEDR